MSPYFNVLNPLNHQTKSLHQRISPLEETTKSPKMDMESKFGGNFCAENEKLENMEHNLSYNTYT